ncbi:MAG: YciI family protein [Chloroflexota bacterium]
MPEYIYLLHPFRHGFFDAPTPEEEAVMSEHFEYLKAATAAGTVLLAGPCLDDTFGLVVFQAESEDAARAFMYNDPSVKNNVMLAELHPMRVSLRAR